MQGGSQRMSNIIGGPGNDTINLYGQTGSNTVDGGDGDDEISGGIGDDTLIGGAGNDFLFGDQGNNILYGGPGNDILKVVGSSGSNELYGGDGDDTLEGGTGNDRLEGGAGADTLSGSDGDDILVGGIDGDVLNGGNGNDTYIVGANYKIEGESPGYGENDILKISTDYTKAHRDGIETIIYLNNAKPLPYWIDAMLDDDAAYFATVLGQEKTFYYGFPDSLPDYAASYWDGNSYVKDPDNQNALGWQSFSSEQRVLTREMMTYFSTLIDAEFKETTEFDKSNTFAFNNNLMKESLGAGGYAMFPSKKSEGNDVYIDVTDGIKLPKPLIGNDELSLFLHETMHAFGLKHPGYGVLPLMAKPELTTGTFSLMDMIGPLDEVKVGILDIAALQYLYGVSKNTRASDDTYTISETATNFIWDGNGTDTIDASALSEEATIHLSPGYHDFVGASANDLITTAGQVTVNFNTKIENLIGTAFSDKLYGNDLNNIISGGSGGDTIDGGAGIDHAAYTENFTDVSLVKSGTVWNITSGNDKDTLSNIERLKFYDKHIAIDLDGNAGKTIKLLGLLLGKDQATDKTYVGAGLKILDDGMPYEQLMQAALDVVLGPNASSLSVVEMIWENLIGPPTPADNISQYSALIDNGTYTAAGLAIVAADHSLNTTAIDLVGLSSTGVEYIL